MSKSRETRRFGMHANLLYDVITKQAGTIQKAILEGVMNAIDAGAKSCRIKLDRRSFSIEDDGRGFRDRKEITDFFEVFGTPHVEGDARYGRFRMGRGQIMAFGANVWRSNGFEMHVDIKKRGLDYDLVEHKDPARRRDGTVIEVKLYQPLLPSDIERTKVEIKRFVAWSEIPISLNGETISTHPATAKWDFEDDDAWYRLSDRTMLDVYNLGVLVNGFNAGRFGTGGTIVSKKPLEVNFARNDVQSTCKVFRRIERVLRAHSNAQAKRKARLTDAEKRSLAVQFLAGELRNCQADELRILSDVTGRTWPLSALLTLPRRYNSQITVAQRGDRLAEMAMKRGLCFAFDEETLHRFDARNAEELLSLVETACTMTDGSDYRFSAIFQMLAHISIIASEQLASFISTDHEPLAPNELSRDDRMLRSAIQAGAQELQRRLKYDGGKEIAGLDFARTREVHLGRSDTAVAWTDGERMIWIRRDLARRLKEGHRGAHAIALVLLHEYLHDAPDTGTHVHDQAFYEAFHDLTGLDIDPVGRAAERMLRHYASNRRREGLRPPRGVLATEDRQAEIAGEEPADG